MSKGIRMTLLKVLMERFSSSWHKVRSMYGLIIGECINVDLARGALWTPRPYSIGRLRQSQGFPRQS